MDIEPNPRRLSAAENEGTYIPGLGRLHYAEYGIGAELVTDKGFVKMDFPNHLDAERFLEAMQEYN